MVPKNFRNNINIHPSKIGPARRQEILDGIADKDTFLPRGISEEDMDQSFVEFVKNDLSISVEGERIPVLFLTIQRWSEFTKTWSFTEGEYKDIKMPFVTVIRKPDIQVGNNQAGLWNIPGNRTYTYMKVPTFDGARKGVDLYKIPQPTSVDIGYEIRVFTGKMKDLNKFNTKVHKAFQSRQFYINVKGHPMPVHLESISDESNIDDFENRRFYIQQFEMTLLGYILDEDDFEIVPTINRTLMFTEIDNIGNNKGIATYKPTFNNNVVDFTFLFNDNSELEMQFSSNYTITFNKLESIINISKISILINNISVLNGLIMNTPIIFNYGDIIKISIERPNNSFSKFVLTGTI